MQVMDWYHELRTYWPVGEALRFAERLACVPFSRARWESLPAQIRHRVLTCATP